MAGVSQSLVFCAICGGLLFFSPPPFFIRSLYCLCFFECPSFIYHCDLQTFLAIFCVINVWENRRGNQEWTIQRYQVFAKRMQFLFCIKTLGILLILDSSSKYKQLGKKLSSCDLSGLADCGCPVYVFLFSCSQRIKQIWPSYILALRVIPETRPAHQIWYLRFNNKIKE
jgi:hypothetical protein